MNAADTLPQQARSSAAVEPLAVARPAGHTVDIDAISHRYGSMLAVDDVTLPIRAGEIVALLGPSGCGKTTLLRIIAGFVSQTAGSVRIDGRAIDRLPANMRNIGIVFQSYALFPHLTVRENIAYGLEARGARRVEVREKVGRFLDVVQLSQFGDRLPRQLSGGQQQRVALARALAVEPRVLLLDEPFGALDKSLRLDMQIELRRLQRQFGLTAILVTHDQDEAMSVADRIAVMNRGRVEQVDTAVAVYDRPTTLFVSGFIGTTNRLPGRVIDVAGGSLGVELAAGARIEARSDRTFAPGDRVIVTVRPEQLAVHAESAAGRWPVRRRLSVPIASTLVHELELRDLSTVRLSEPRGPELPDAAAELWCGIRADARPSVFPDETTRA